MRESGRRGAVLRVHRASSRVARACGSAAGPLAALALACGLLAPGAVGAQAVPTLLALGVTRQLADAGPAARPSTSSASEEGDPAFTITRFVVEGARRLDPGQLDAALAPFTGTRRRFADIQGAIAVLRAAYERLGITAVSVIVPEQVLESGVVRLLVEELSLGAVEVSGARHRTVANVRRAVPGLLEGSVPDEDDLAEQVRLANENPGRQMQVTLRAESDGRLVAVLRVADRPSLYTQGSFDNSGTTATGRYRVGAVLQHQNLLDRDIVGTVQVQTSPGYEREVQIASVGIRVPLYGTAWLLDAGFFHSTVDAGAVRTGAGDYFLASRGEVWSLRLTRLLRRTGALEPRLWVGVERKRVESGVAAFPGGPSLIPDIVLQPVSLGLAGAWRGGALGVSGQIVASVNVPGSGRSAAAVFAETGLRADANPRYTIVRASLAASWSATGSGGVAVNWGGQWSADALLAAEQFSIGGEGSVRGFAGRLVSGDAGQRASLEWQSPSRPMLDGAPYEVAWLLFVDGAQARRNLPQPAERVQHVLTGAGAGVRVKGAGWPSVRLDVGLVLRGDGVAPTGSSYAHLGVDHAF